MIPPTTRVTLNAAPTAYHQTELDGVVRIANSRRGVLPDVEAFEIAPNRQDAHHREHLTQIRAIAVTPDGDVEFRSSLPLRHSGLDGCLDLSFVDADGEQFVGTLHQSNGMIVGWLHSRDRRWRLKYGDLIVWGKGLPDTLRDSLTYRRVGEIIRHPELPSDAVIEIVDDVTSVDPELDDDEEMDGWMRLTLRITVAETDAASGLPRDTWLEPGRWGSGA